MKKLVFISIFLLECLTSFAQRVPNYSRYLKFIRNPNASRWVGTNSAMTTSRFCMTLFPYRGKVYLSGGDWNANTGPCPIFAIDPKTDKFTEEYLAGTETIWYFRQGSDGRLYVPGVDLKEGSKTVGAYFRREPRGTWTNLLNGARGNIQEFAGGHHVQGYVIHTWDLVCWKRKVFIAGYGISYGNEGSNELFIDATPCLTSCLIKTSSKLKTDKQDTFTVMRRFESFLPFQDELFCYPLAYRMPNSQNGQIVEQWRFDETKGIFERGTNTWSNLYPDDAAVPLFGQSVQATVPQCVVPFRNKCLYLIGAEGQRQRPRGLCMATNANHTVYATRINFPEGEIPVNITAFANKIATLTIKRLNDGKFINSVWESVDGVSFTNSFTFSFRNGLPAGAFCRIGSTWFFSVGIPFSNQAQPKITYDGTEGSIYRIDEPVK